MSACSSSAGGCEIILVLVRSVYMGEDGKYQAGSVLCVGLYISLKWKGKIADLFRGR